MPATTNIVHLEGKGDEPVDRKMWGETIMVAIMIGYPGSKTSDILIGEHVVRVPNEDLRDAYATAEEICRENFAGG
jgi:hypothetical protein